MNADLLYTLLNDLPDDYITAAAGTHKQSRRPLYMIVPALAACITLLIAAAVYPKLKTQRPERQDPVFTAETTAPQGTEPAVSELPEEKPSAETAVRTAETAAPQTTGAVRTDAVIAETAAVTAAQPETAAPSRPDTTAAAQTEPSAETTATRRTVPAQAVEEPEPITTTTKSRHSESVMGEDPGSEEEPFVQTVPFRMKQERTAIPQENEETPAVVPSVPATVSPTTVPPEPVECTTPAETTTAPQPPPDENPPERPQPSVRYDGLYWIIHPMRPYKDVMLLSGALNADGTLSLNLLCLTGSEPSGDTVQIDLLLPPEISDAITGARVQITETDSEAFFAEVTARAPVIINCMKKEDDL
ncbi:MAG: hypothetical protein J5722_00085 [Oscillospiraceae bacterium]|nr:hypothetical protein [Oscillospiraceae bacterium]